MYTFVRCYYNNKQRINRRGKIASLFGRPKRAVAAILMEALQVCVVDYYMHENTSADNVASTNNALY
jgi:hypothetical protein